jgi:hypothetical protein
MASEIEDLDARFAPLSALASQLTKLPPTSVHELWSQALHRSAVRSRANLLSDLRAFLPFIDILGGRDIAHEVILSIYDAEQCWPA